MPRRDVEPLIGSAVDLDLRDRADAETDPERRQAQQVAVEPREREVGLVQEIEAALDEHQAGADRFRILGAEWALLRGGRGGPANDEGGGRGPCKRSCHQISPLRCRRSARPGGREKTGINVQDAAPNAHNLSAFWELGVEMWKLGVGSWAFARVFQHPPRAGAGCRAGWSPVHR